MVFLGCEELSNIKPSMDTLKITSERFKSLLLGCLVPTLFSATAAYADPSLSLASRLKEFNSVPVAVAEQVMAAKPKRASSRGRRACHQSSAETILKRANDYQPYIRAASTRHGVTEALIIAVITAESCFAEQARSPVGAQGLMQLMPATASRFGVTDAYQASQNIQGGTRYLKFLMKKFSGNLPHVIAAYNAGEGAVDRYSGIPPYRETQEYVRRVTAVYKRLRGEPAAQPQPAAAPDLASTLAKLAPEPIRRADTRGYFIKPDYKWKDKNGRYATVPVSTSRRGVAPNTASAVCRDTPSAQIRNVSDLTKRRNSWKRHHTVTNATSLASLARTIGVSMQELLRLNRGVSRLKVRKGEQLLVWECSK